MFPGLRSPSIWFGRCWSSPFPETFRGFSHTVLSWQRNMRNKHFLKQHLIIKCISSFLPFLDTIYRIQHAMTLCKPPKWAGSLCGSPCEAESAKRIPGTPETKLSQNQNSERAGGFSLRRLSEELFLCLPSLAPPWGENSSAACWPFSLIKSTESHCTFL